ncbi:Plasma membrane sulfite pump involved in sulfite metabolism [Coemansia javaensis]|uniref:Plasma membrane sulfite pump involved in sulfite metabolism n=1 Tax=Coemansia javaensis TaxID=2761396 RepID=A0A9W8HGP9_9FUNG|nr:Plasma membrane sulfite pump involved in sulfite metabolism [Coemansia javaensis]
MAASDVLAKARDMFGRTLNALCRAVLLFRPPWFTVNMGSGILATCIWRIPYEVGALRVLGCVVFYANVALLALFLVLLAVQMVAFPAAVERCRRRMLHYGAVPMALAAVANGVAAFPASDVRPAAVYVGWGLWWAAAALAAGASALLVCLVMSREVDSLESVTGAWLLLVAPLGVCASVAGSFAAQLPPSQAAATLVVGYCLLGAGAPLICCIVVLYMHRVAVHKLPPHDAILTAFIPVGPVAQIGGAALSLGVAAQDTAALSSAGALGATMYHLGVVAALLAWGSAAFWALHAVLSVAYQRRTAPIPFNIGWWALVFPLGVFASLTADLGEALDMRAFGVGFCVLAGLLLLLWLLMMARTVAGIWTGSILGGPAQPPKDPDDCGV